MSKKLHNKLLKKGWTIEEIKHLTEQAEKAKHKKTPFVKFLDKSVFWLFLAVAIIGNAVVSLIMIPIFLIFSGLTLYSVIAILAIILGLFLDHLIHDMEHLTAKHHIGALVVLLPLAAVTAGYIVMFTRAFIERFGLAGKHDPVMVAVVYTIALILPYIATKLVNIRI